LCACAIALIEFRLNEESTILIINGLTENPVIEEIRLTDLISNRLTDFQSNFGTGIFPLISDRLLVGCGIQRRANIGIIPHRPCLDIFRDFVHEPEHSFVYPMSISLGYRFLETGT
jgi:hypothetical protein